jgi:large-conductance mechanosensitive channel
MMIRYSNILGSVLAFLFLGNLFIFHVKMITNNMTTIEYQFKSDKGKNNMYNRGSALKNAEASLGV